MKITRRLRKQPRRRSDRRGAAAVEFAFVAPLLMMLLFGATELGRAMYIQNSVTAAAREAARESTLPSATQQTVEAIVGQYTNDFSEGTPAVTINPAINAAEAGDMMTVTVSVPTSTLSSWGRSWLGQSFNVSSSATMRREGYE